MLQRERRLARARAALHAELGREPALEEIAAAADVSLAHALALSRTPRVVTSLDQPVSKDVGAPLGELLEAPDPDVGEVVVVSLRREAVRRAVDELPEPDRELIRLRFGIDDDVPRPQGEVGRRLGLTRRQVREIEERALAQLGRLRELEALADAA
jgi:RNA polymerase primary sigma factor